MESTGSIASYIGYTKGFDAYTRLWYEFYYDSLVGATQASKGETGSYLDNYGAEFICSMKYYSEKDPMYTKCVN